MSLFHRKRLAHQIVGEKIHVEMFNRDEIKYRCTICTLTFSNAREANSEQCIGKTCYLAYTPKPPYLMSKEEIEATRRKVTQEPSAYICNPYFSKKPMYTPLYDVRECVSLENAVLLPDFEEA